MICQAVLDEDPVAGLLSLSNNSVPVLKLSLGVSVLTLEQRVNVPLDQQCG